MFYKILQTIVQCFGDDNLTRALTKNGYKPIARDEFPHNQNRLLRGRWPNRLYYLLTIIGMCIGLGNVWKFPIVCYENGAAAFLLIYFCLTFIYAFPLLLLEMGIGQFFSKSSVKVFNSVPILHGIGYTMVFNSFLITTIYGVVMAWAYFYIFAAIVLDLPWNHCNNYFNSFNCLSSYIKHEDVNKSKKHIFAAEEYFDYFVISLKKYPSGEETKMSDPFEKPRWQLSLCLIWTWILVNFILSFDFSTSGRVLYFTVIFPYFAFIGLLVRFSVLPGAFHGIVYYLTPQWEKMMDPHTYFAALSHLTCSYAFGQGTLITLSSFNDFHDNFFKDAIIITFADAITSFLSGFVSFSVFGYMSHKSGERIETIYKRGTGLFFVAFPSSIATDNFSKSWSIVLMLTAITMGTQTQIAIISSIIGCICDLSSYVLHNKHRRLLISFIIALINVIIGLLLLTPVGYFWFIYLDNSFAASFAATITVLMEIIIFCHVYGLNRLKGDYKMMLGRGFSNTLLNIVAYIVPLLLIGSILVEIVTSKQFNKEFEIIPVFARVITIIAFFLLISPLFIFGVLTVWKFRKEDPDEKIFTIIKRTCRPRIGCGPYYHIHWVLDDRYKDILIKYRKDERFLATLHPHENIDEILSEFEEKQPTNKSVLFEDPSMYILQKLSNLEKSNDHSDNINDVEATNVS